MLGTPSPPSQVASNQSRQAHALDQKAGGSNDCACERLCILVLHRAVRHRHGSRRCHFADLKVEEALSFRAPPLMALKRARRLQPNSKGLSAFASSGHAGPVTIGRLVPGAAISPSGRLGPSHLITQDGGCSGRRVRQCHSNPSSTCGTARSSYRFFWKDCRRRQSQRRHPC
jgi:hypothetical protein